MNIYFQKILIGYSKYFISDFRLRIRFRLLSAWRFCIVGASENRAAIRIQLTDNLSVRVYKVIAPTVQLLHQRE